MNIHFYYNSSDNRCLFKKLLDETIYSGTLRNETSLIRPEITINSVTPIRFNYAYIPDFKRYYYINSVKSIRNGLWELSLEIDPLMSFKGDIATLQVVVDKQAEKENGDEYIDDGSLVSQNLLFNTIINFSDGFNDNPQYILITAG